MLGAIAYLAPLIFVIFGVTTYLQIDLAAQPSLPPASVVLPTSIKECDKCPAMVVVPAGGFTMGSPAIETGRDIDEGPQHRVTFAEPIAVGRFAVTFDEWDACVDDGFCDGYKPQDQGWGRGSRPVINVSYDNAVTYVEWLSRKTGKAYRLLTEAEWEYAARAGSTTAYYWGTGIGKGNANCDGCGSKWDNDADFTCRIVCCQCVRPLRHGWQCVAMGAGLLS